MKANEHWTYGFKQNENCSRNMTDMFRFLMGRGQDNEMKLYLMLPYAGYPLPELVFS